ncbi:MAG: glycine cleavage system aminomethyltransferase GcvT [Flavobacteriales bacterium]|nr:glycine cleavage system aminomethyltransferase GcvT [Flavobacteriales bacterium]
MSNTEQLKNTSLTHVHQALGAKMVPFAGYNMPVQYTGLKEEHFAVRNSVGMFDVSHMGEFMVKGEKATDLLEWITSNDISKLVNMQAQYNCMPNKTGGIVDDLIVYKWAENEYYLVVNASNIEKDWNWIVSQNEEKGFGVELQNMSEAMSLLAVQGPNAQKLVQKLTDVDLSAIEFYHFAMGKVANIDDVIISNTGYTGAGGFELYVANEHAENLWNAIMEAGKEYDILPCGLGCRDTLRLEKGYCLYGNDINDETSPIEAGLGWITKFEKPFVNWEHHAKIKADKPTKKLVGFEMIDRGIPRQHYPIVDAAGNTIGEVTSGTQSPSLDKAIGMGYVKADFSKLGSEIFVEIRGKALKAEVVKLPFL